MTRTQIVMEELLTLGVYAFDQFAMPSFRKWDEGYEGWLYRNGLLRRMQYLEKQKFLIREGKTGEWVFRLTRMGRAVALGGRDPEALWQRPWDGWWRQIIFDLPVDQQKTRHKLIRWLKRNGFGYLQDSVWISPDPVKGIASAMKSFADNAEAFTILESRCAVGFSDGTLVKGAWPFDRINEAYEVYQRHAKALAARLRKERLHPRELFDWIRKDRAQWRTAFERDPLLPVPLWPKEYSGRRAWNTRRDLLKLFAAQIPRG